MLEKKKTKNEWKGLKRKQRLKELTDQFQFTTTTKKRWNLKEKVKILNKDQIQKKEKKASERDYNQNIVKDLWKDKRELQKRNATLTAATRELETIVHSSSKH